MTGWLIAWLWQGMVLVLAASAILKVLPRINAATRYAIWFGVLLLLAWLGWSAAPTVAPAVAVTMGSVVAEQPVSFIEVPALSNGAISFIFTLWLSISLFKLLRVLTGLTALYRLKDSCGPVLESIESRLPLWREVQRQGRPVRLMLCNDLPNAAVLGLQDPIIAIPPRLLRLVSSAELDQIVLHEYGHVQRRDDWTRLAQALLEAAIWIHPATYVASRHLNLEREVACDDWVIAKTRAARDYAECLARVTEAHHSRVEPSLVPALFGRTPDVLRRVDRLLNARRNATREVSMAAALVGAAVAIVFAAQLRTVPLVGEITTAFGLPQLPATAEIPLRGAVRPQPPATVPPGTTLVRKPSTARNTNNKPVDPRPDKVVSAAVPEDLPISSISNRQLGPLVLDPPPSTKHQGPTKNQAPSTKDQEPTGFSSIGRATRKASVALAGSLTKASVSLANSFQP